MSNHIDKLLSPYMDGELSRETFLQVKSHLASCDACASNLRALKSLSSTLHETEAPDFPSKDIFAKKVLINLPEKQSSFNTQNLARFGMWLFPIVLMVIWVFFASTTKINNAVVLANDLNLLNEASTILAVPSTASAEITSYLSQFGIIDSNNNAVISVIESLITSNLSSLYLNASISIFYMVWLFVWWMQNNQITKKLSFSKRNT
jgi:hypothetical protein